MILNDDKYLKHLSNYYEKKIKYNTRKCIKCDKSYEGTHFQRWCHGCRHTINNNYWEEFEVNESRKNFTRQHKA